MTLTDDRLPPLGEPPPDDDRPNGNGRKVTVLTFGYGDTTR